MTHMTLQITATETRIFSAGADVRLPLGDSVIDGFIFQHSPVTAYEAEVAIEHIENRIIPARAALPAGDLILYCPDPRLNYLLTGDDAGFLFTGEIERAFNEIVNVISGSPVSSTSLPSDKQFTAFLLIIREITHHWGLTGLVPGTAGKNDVI
ncbi:hypothetical protein [Morganella morganii]|uniref:hypothetical protein n=1 Tax=Morganella morganii TaxID=582 RepID=UPI000F4A59D5|nr:hypothetical protein [Morganella morganii]ROJ29934.1 hypothetical protein BFD15_14780 [Morganella morganii]